jgi:transcription initiation factor IIF auxiliary subunit
MTIKIENYAKKVEERNDYNWYKWKVFVKEEKSILNTIKEVIYLLHPTFRNPERIVRSRDEMFALEGSGWGSFDVTVTIIFIDKREEIQTYFLDLNKEWPE